MCVLQGRFTKNLQLVCFFWVIPRRLNFICRRFGTLCLFYLHRQVGTCRMNQAGDMFGVLYWKRFGLEMACQTLLLVGRLRCPTNNLPPTVSSHSSCVPTGHHELSQRVTVPYAACIQFYPPEDEHLMLETCRGEQYFINK